MGELYRILVTGWRDADEQHRPHIILNLGRYGASRLGRRGITLLHGDAPGADDWDRYGRAAGAMRNAHMIATRPDVCIAFLGPNSKGTWDCIEKAVNAGIVTHIYPLAVADG